MSNFSDQLKASELVLIGEFEKLAMAEITDLEAKLPVQYQALVVALQAALAPAIKTFIDGEIAKIGA